MDMLGRHSIGVGFGVEVERLTLTKGPGNITTHFGLDMSETSKLVPQQVSFL